jgi:hypothetical protein
MRRFLKLSTLVAGAGLASVVSACSPDTIVTTGTIPSAGTRFINAVPDSAGAFGMDFRPVDIVENSDQFRMLFRGSITTSAGAPGATQIEFKGTRAGDRHFRIFLSDSIQTIASFVVRDTTMHFDANNNYTAILWGNARSSGSDKMRFTVWQEDVPDPGTNVAIRVINATGNAIDVRNYVASGTIPAAATWASVPAYSKSTYITVAPGSYKLNVQPAGGGTALFADVTSLPGTPALNSGCNCTTGKVDLDAIPGTTVAGSAVSLIVFPASTPGTRVSQAAAFLVPAGAFVWDRRPPRAPGT